MWQKILYLGFLALLGSVLALGGPSGDDGGETTNGSGSGESTDGRGSIDPNGIESRGSIDPDGLGSGGGVDPDGHPRS